MFYCGYAYLLDRQAPVRQVPEDWPLHVPQPINTQLYSMCVCGGGVCVTKIENKTETARQSDTEPERKRVRETETKKVCLCAPYWMHIVAASPLA